LSDSSAKTKTVEAIPKSPKKVVAYTPSAKYRGLSFDKNSYTEIDRLTGTIESVEGNRVTIRLLDDIRVDSNGIRAPFKRDTLAFLDANDHVYIDVSPEDQSKVLLRVDGPSYRVDLGERIYGDLSSLTPGIWVMFIWTRTEGAQEPFRLETISLMRNT
jgi:hypothetical protein